MQSGELDLLIADSVAAMVTEKEYEAETGKVQMADRAKMMAQFMRQITGPIQKYQVACVFLNHLQEVIDASPMGQRLKAAGVTRKTTPGGVALKFYASMRLEYKAIGTIRNTIYDPLKNEEVDAPQQSKVQVTVVKNKVAQPFRQCEVRVRYGKGFSQAYSLLDILTQHKIIKKGGGGMYKFPEHLSPQKDGSLFEMRGEENLLVQIETNPSWMKVLEKEARGLLDIHGAYQADATEWEDQDTEGVQVQAFIPDEPDVNPETGEIPE
jgi:recombination protein RecA